MITALPAMISSSGQCRCVISSAAAYAPTAMKAPCPMEICPLTPISTVSPATATTKAATSASS